MNALTRLKSQLRAVDPYAGRKYLREYTEAFSRYERALSEWEFQAALAGAEIVLLGDYHALPQSQTFAAEVVEFLATSGRKVVFGVEALFTSDQPLLDCWQALGRNGAGRAMTELALRTALQYDDEWGYSWQPFYGLLLRARAAGAYIAALDECPRRDLRSIGRRDRHAVATIAALRARHPGAVLVALFGESHLAPQHLPARLLRALEAGNQSPAMLTVLQNVDALYWQAAAQRAGSTDGELVPAVQVKPGVVCVFNASPLEKYESYRLCLERWHDG